MFEFIFAQNNNEEKENLEDRKMFDELAEYIVNNNISSGEIEEAYFRLCGVTDSDSPSEVVTQLEERMQSMTERRFPLNRFVKLIETTGLVENGEKNFYAFVDGLDITIKEKEALKSIVLKKRSGGLTILTESNQEPLSEITINAADIPAHLLGFMLSQKIKEVLAREQSEQKVNFQFEEK